MKMTALFVMAITYCFETAVVDHEASNPTSTIQPDASKLVARLAQYFKQFDRSQFTARVDTFENDPQWAPPDVPSVVSTLQIWRRDGYWKCIVDEKFQHYENGKLIRGRSKAQRIFPPVEWGEINAGYDDKDQGIVDSIVVRANLSDEERTLAFVGLGCAPLVSGILPLNQPSLVQLLRESKLTVRVASAEGTSYWLLESIGPWGVHAVYFDRSQSPLPRRIVERKQQNDFCMWGRKRYTVSQVPIRIGPLAETNREIVVTSAKLVGNDNIITQYVEQYQYKRTDGTVLSKEKRTVSFSDIHPNAEFGDDVFTLVGKVPEGKLINVEDQPGIEYEWRDGRIRKRINATSLANLEGLQFLGGSWLGKGVIILAAVALVLLLGLGWHRFRRRLRGQVS
jgi:hypothetical protein